MKKNIRKSIFYSVLTLGIGLFSVFGSYTNIYANENVECEIVAQDGNVGGEVTIKINVISNPGTIMSETQFEYDSDVLEITSMQSHDIFAGDITKGVVSEWSQPNLNANPIKTMDGYFTIRGNTSNTGLMYTIKAKVKNSAALGDTTVRFTGRFLDWELNDFYIVCDDAVINIGEAKDTKNDRNTILIIIIVVLIFIASIVTAVFMKKKDNNEVHKTDDIGHDNEDINNNNNKNSTDENIEN